MLKPCHSRAHTPIFSSSARAAAGLFAALHAFRPILARLSPSPKGLLGKSGCTRMVQGGYNVAVQTGDSPQPHFMNTITGGHWFPHQGLAWTLASPPPARRT